MLGIPSRQLGLVALGWVALSAAPAHAGTIDWSSFDKVLDECDMLDVRIDSNVVSGAAVQFVLDAAPAVTGYKGIQIWDSRGNGQLIATEGTKKTDSIMVSAGWMPGGTLDFEKAGGLGWHYIAYNLPNLTNLQPGTRVTFKWIQDVCPDLSLGYLPSKSTIPTWMKPGETRQVQVAIANLSMGWGPDQRLEFFERTGNWNMAPSPLATRVTLWGDFTFNVTITAPMAPGNYKFDLAFHQRGGTDEATVKTTSIAVQSVQPPPSSPPRAQKPVTVPDVMHQSAAAAGTALTNLGLPIYVMADPTPLDPRKTVIAQWPIPNAIIPAGTSVWLAFQPDSEPDGFSALEITNCRRGQLVVYAFKGDGWAKVGTVDSQVGDSGCPRAGSQPFNDSTADGKLNYHVVVDPDLCTDPANTTCRVYEWYAWGNSAGETFATVIE
jgi:hypothetical protein